MLRPTTATDRTPRRALHLLVLISAIALLAAACGDGDDTIEIDGAAATGEDDPGPAEDADDPDDAGGTEADGDAEDVADEEPEPDAEASEDGGLREHRPSEEARAAIDCDAVANPAAGALLAFPRSDDPASLQAGPGPVTVEVVGCSDTFEATVQYDAFHGQNTTPTLSGFTQGGTLGSWDVFSFEETYWTPGDWTVVVYVDDAESGDRVEYDQVTFTVD